MQLIRVNQVLIFGTIKLVSHCLVKPQIFGSTSLRKVWREFGWAKQFRNHRLTIWGNTKLLFGTKPNFDEFGYHTTKQFDTMSHCLILFKIQTPNKSLVDWNVSGHFFSFCGRMQKIIILHSFLIQIYYLHFRLLKKSFRPTNSNGNVNGLLFGRVWNFSLVARSKLPNFPKPISNHVKLFGWRCPTVWWFGVFLFGLKCAKLRVWLCLGKIICASHSLGKFGFKKCQIFGYLPNSQTLA